MERTLGCTLVLAALCTQLIVNIIEFGYINLNWMPQEKYLTYGREIVKNHSTGAPQYNDIGQIVISVTIIMGKYTRST